MINKVLLTAVIIGGGVIYAPVVASVQRPVPVVAQASPTYAGEPSPVEPHQALPDNEPEAQAIVAAQEKATTPELVPNYEGILTLPSHDLEDGFSNVCYRLPDGAFTNLKMKDYQVTPDLFTYDGPVDPVTQAARTNAEGVAWCNDHDPKAAE